MDAAACCSYVIKWSVISAAFQQSVDRTTPTRQSTNTDTYGGAKPQPRLCVDNRIEPTSPVQARRFNAAVAAAQNSRSLGGTDRQALPRPGVNAESRRPWSGEHFFLGPSVVSRCLHARLFDFRGRRSKHSHVCTVHIPVHRNIQRFRFLVRRGGLDYPDKAVAPMQARLCSGERQVHWCAAGDCKPLHASGREANSR